MKEKIEFVPIDKIRVLNPRRRERRKFERIVASIRDEGLKKPIKVSLTGNAEGTYDLVYGQGRMEACLALGHDRIPAIVVDIPREDRLLMSLVENIARRFPRPSDIIREIQRLLECGDTQKEIARKLGFSESTISGYVALSQAGEERLLDAALKDKISIGVALEITRAGDVDAQRALLDAYEKREITQGSIRVIKRLFEQRRLMGKSRATGRRKTKATAEAMISTYRRDAEKKKALVRKSRVCENRLTFIFGALRKLLADEDFRNLLRAEKLHTLPDFLAEKINPKVSEAA